MPNLERVRLIGIGAVQGLIVWWLLDHWPDEGTGSAAFLAVLYFLICQGLALHFSWTGRDYLRLVLVSALLGVVYALVSFWVGLQLIDVEEAVASSSDRSRAASWAFAAGITLYVAAPFMQIYQRTGRFEFPYTRLFLHAWSNFHIGLIGLLFLGVLWAVLRLWAALFNLIGVEAFGDLFGHEIFVSIVSGGAIAFGLSLGRDREQLVAALRNITLGVFRALLPLVSFVALLFLVFVPFTGLQPLWDTDSGSHILLAWIVTSILFLNAAYQDGTEQRPYSQYARKLVEAGVIAMVAFTAFSLYGLFLRVGQHGLTPGRVYGLVIVLMLGFYVIGYSVAVFRAGNTWLPLVARVNFVAAPIAVALGLLMHTPILDPIGVSARSQYARLVDGRVGVEEFDFAYLRFRLGREGLRGFEALETLADHPESARIRERAAEARDLRNYGVLAEALPIEMDIDLYPAGASWPPGLRDAINRDLSAIFRRPAGAEYRIAVFATDLSADPGDEYVVVRSNVVSQAFALRRTESGTWERFAEYMSRPAPSFDELVESIETSSFGGVPPDILDLEIGEHRFRSVGQ
ncbi:MAG: DUF4153 domain-containing protein [Candidatus Rariloculaceae bacterium]